MSVNRLLDLLMNAFLNVGINSPVYAVLSVVYFFVLYGLFRKCGIRSWHAFVPCLREASLGEAAGREKEGRVLAACRGIIILSSLVTAFVPMNDPELAGRVFGFISIVTTVVNLVIIIYSIRIYVGLIEVFDQKKRWVVLWVLAEWLPACLWGWMKEYQPLWTVSELKNDRADFFSNAKAAVLDKGLTVNLEERTARDFFKTKYLLRDIHMYIKPGHMVLLLGGSGAGKTTFLNAVNGYEKAKAEVVLNGRNMYKNYKEMQYDIGFVPQLDLMRGSDSVFRTLMDAASLRLPADFSRADRQARVEEVMTIFGLIGTSIPAMLVFFAVSQSRNGFDGNMGCGFAPVIMPVATIVSIVAVLYRQNSVNRELEAAKEKKLIWEAEDLEKAETPFRKEEKGYWKSQGRLSKD